MTYGPYRFLLATSVFLLTFSPSGAGLTSEEVRREEETSENAVTAVIWENIRKDTAENKAEAQNSDEVKENNETGSLLYAQSFLSWARGQMFGEDPREDPNDSDRRFLLGVKFFIFMGCVKIIYRNFDRD